MLRTTSLIAVLLLATPAVANEGCIVDYNTFELRAIGTDDPASMLSEQTLTNYDWGTELDAEVAGEQYEKYGLSRELAIMEVTFYAWKDSVPFTRESTNTDTPPEILYALTDPETCAFQPYQLKSD